MSDFKLLSERNKRKEGRPRKKAIGRPITHGATSYKSIMTHASFIERKLYRDIFAMELHLTPTDKIVVQGLAQNLAVIKLLWGAFNQQGILDKHGKPIDALRVFATHWKNVFRACNDLGLTTATKVKLGLDVMKGRNLEKEYGEDD